MQKLPIRISVLSLLISLLFSACIPAGDYYSASDPELAAIQAQSRADSIAQQATVIADRTAVAEAEAVRATEVEQARRDQASATEIALIEARAQERKDEVAMQSTEAAIWSAYATATVAPMATQAAWQMTQPAFEATKQAIERQARDAEAKSWAIQTIYNYGPVVLGAMAVAFTVVSCIGLLFYLEWKRLRNSVVRTPTGLLLFNGGTVKMLPAGDSRVYDTEPESEITDYAQLPAVDIRPGRSYAQFDTPQVAIKPDERAKAIQFLDDSIEVNGEDSRQIPSWRKLKDSGHNWDSTNWQEVKGWLEAKGLVESNGGGTFIVDYPSLQNLYFALVTKKV